MGTEQVVLYRPKKNRIRGNLMRKVTPYLAITPIFVFLGIFAVYPMMSTFYHSMTRWDGFTTRFIGLLNFERIIFSGEFFFLLRNNLIVLASVPLITITSVVVTLLLYEKVAGWKFFRSVYYIPTTLSAVVVGFLMKTLFASRGLVNGGLTAIGLEEWAIDWLGKAPTAFVIIILCFYWQTLGQGVLIFLSGLSSISTDIFEAARIDGAGWWSRLFSVVLPLLVPTLTFFVLQNVIWVFIGLFGLIYTVTQGGPGYETTPIDYMIYLKAFQEAQFGYASALSVLLFFIVLTLSIIQLRIANRLDSWR